VRIRLARPTDAAAVQVIYAPIVTDTVISFELEPPTVEEMERRITETLAEYPWLVAERHDHVIGYAYGHRFAGRAAYAWSVESSIYIADNARGQGVGRRLYDALLPVLRAQGYQQVFAGATLPNPASVALHERVGFRPVGIYRRAGWKFGAWHDVGMWQLALDDDGAEPSPPRRLEALPPGALERLLVGSAR